LVADRLDVPADYVVATVERAPQQISPDGPPAPEEDRGVAPRLDAEGVYLALCAAAGPAGRDYLDRVTDAHLASTLLRRARDHLKAHPGDPLADLAAQDRDLAALLTALAARAAEETEPANARLRLDFLYLDKRRIERELRHARAAEDFDMQRELAAALQKVRAELDLAMGEDS
jgi:hypothetical protein